MQFAISVLAISLFLFSEVFGTSGASASPCTSKVNRDDAIRILAEGSARSAKRLPVGSIPDGAAVAEAKRKIVSQLSEGWNISVRERPDCTFQISLDNPQFRGGGMSVRVDGEKRILKIFQHR
jgi:hypothetical protein